MSREIPPNWHAAMDRVGHSSMRSLAGATGVHTSTISAMIHGDRETAPDTVYRVAEVLGVDVVTVSKWVGQARSVTEPYRPPSEADLLTSRQRKAVDEIIRAMAEREESTHGTAKKRAGDAGAQIHEMPKPPTMEEIQDGRAAAHRTRPKGPKGDRQS